MVIHTLNGAPGACLSRSPWSGAIKHWLVIAHHFITTYTCHKSPRRVGWEVCLQNISDTQPHSILWFTLVTSHDRFFKGRACLANATEAYQPKSVINHIGMPPGHIEWSPYPLNSKNMTDSRHCKLRHRASWTIGMPYYQVSWYSNLCLLYYMYFKDIHALCLRH